MKTEEIQALVDANLEHIPRGDHGSSQSLLRANYLTIRLRDLAEDPTRTRLASLSEAIELVRQIDPEFEPEFERAYFGAE